MTVKDLIIHLIESGYRYLKPRSRTWKSAYIFKHQDSVLCILFRKNGIDLRYYEKYSTGIHIHQGNFVTMSGGEIFRNYYNESNNLITQKIKVIAGCFANGEILNALRSQDGQSYLLNRKYQSIRENSKKEFKEEYMRLQDVKAWKGIVDLVREDSGGYWGDGRWM